MNRTDAPVKQSTPFAVNGQREPILPTTPAGDNTASYSDGFPPITMTLKSAGGLPPKGQDMNQILYELSNLARWSSSGALNSWDAEFSTAISGYPKGVVLLGNDGTTIYISNIDANTNNPNTTSTGWLNLSKITAIAALAGGANKLPYFTGSNTAAQTDFTSVGRDIIGKAAVSDVITYLGLKTAALRDVGTNASQIPDMSSFSYQSDGGRLHAHYLPSSNGTHSFLLETGLFTAPPGLSVCTPPIAPPSKILSVVASQRSNSTAGGTFSVELITGNLLAFNVYNSGVSTIDIQWQAWCI